METAPLPNKNEINNISQEVLFDIEPKKDYLLFGDHYREDSRLVPTNKLERDYSRYTDELIGNITGTLEESSGSQDLVIYLDKSARPVEALVRELWPDLARKLGTKFEDNIVPERPQTMFLNIDRNQWSALIDPESVGAANVDKLPKEVIDSLAQLLQLADKEKADSPFEGKRILIVDEVGVTGATLRIAEAFIRKAAPNAEVSTHHWMQPGIYGDHQGKRNLDIPIWYRQDTAQGRFVGNRDVYISSQSHSKAQKIGKWLLSTPLRGEDKLSDNLRHDIKLLAKKLRSGEIFFTPSAKRDTDDFLERAQVMNNMTQEEFLDKKREQEEEEKKLKR